MAVRWEKLAGDTATFAVKAAFVDDPDPGQGQDEDTWRSWGGFQLWVEGRNLCAHEEDGERVEYVHWYLLPLFEWFVRNWNPLLHEERVPCRNTGDDGWEALRHNRFAPPALDEEGEDAWDAAWQRWWLRHALQAASEGGIFPDVVLRRLRDAVEISWGPAAGQGVPHHFRFANAGPASALFDPRAVGEPLHQVLSDAIAHLAKAMPESSRYRQLNTSAQRLRTHQKNQRVMWLAGLGEDETSVRKGWRRAKDQLSSLTKPVQDALLATAGGSRVVLEGSSAAALMFGSTAPSIGKDDVLEIANVLVELSSGPADGALNSISRDEPLDTGGGPPWQQGYSLAEEFLEELGLSEREGDDRVDIERLLDKLGVNRIRVGLADESIRVVAMVGPNLRPGVGWNRNNHANLHEYGRRFTLAHELCHLLFDRGAGQRLAMASGPWAPVAIERRANAFAAMLLMPTSRVRHIVAGLNEPIRLPSVETISHRLRTSFEATLQHLRNLGYLDRDQVDRIRTDRGLGRGSRPSGWTAASGPMVADS